MEKHILETKTILREKNGFWTSVFFFIRFSGHISRTKGAAGDLLVSKWPIFLGLFRFWDFRFQISGHMLATKRGTGHPLVSKRPELKKVFRFSTKNDSGFIDYVFLDIWLYHGNEKCYRRSTGVKTTRFFKGFWLPAWVTRPQHPKGTKDEVQRPKKPPTRRLLVLDICTQTHCIFWTHLTKVKQKALHFQDLHTCVAKFVCPDFQTFLPILVNWRGNFAIFLRFVSVVWVSYVLLKMQAC